MLTARRTDSGIQAGRPPCYSLEHLISAASCADAGAVHSHPGSPTSRHGKVGILPNPSPRARWSRSRSMFIFIFIFIFGPDVVTRASPHTGQDCTVLYQSRCAYVCTVLYSNVEGCARPVGAPAAAVSKLMQGYCPVRVPGVIALRPLPLLDLKFQFWKTSLIS
jgi:hypothetical protein